MGTLKQVFSDSLRTPWERLSQKSARKGSDLGVPWGESVRRQKCEKRTTVLKFSGRPGPARVPIRRPCLGGPGDFRTPLAETCEIWGGPRRASLFVPFWSGFGSSRQPPLWKRSGPPGNGGAPKASQKRGPGPGQLADSSTICTWRDLRLEADQVHTGSRRVSESGRLGLQVFQKVV